MVMGMLIPDQLKAFWILELLFIRRMCGVAVRSLSVRRRRANGMRCPRHRRAYRINLLQGGSLAL
jgi:hypothetical protein